MSPEKNAAVVKDGGEAKTEKKKFLWREVWLRGTLMR